MKIPTSQRVNKKHKGGPDRKPKSALNISESSLENDNVNSDISLRLIVIPESCGSGKQVASSRKKKKSFHK